MEAAAAFYDPVLATLGLRRFKQRDGAIGYGPDDGSPAIFWILARADRGSAEPGTGLHVSFRAADRAEVHAFYETALASAAATPARPASARTTPPASTAASSSTSTASRSKPRSARLWRSSG